MNSKYFPNKNTKRKAIASLNLIREHLFLSKLWMVRFLRLERQVNWNENVRKVHCNGILSEVEFFIFFFFVAVIYFSHALLNFLAHIELLKVKLWSHNELIIPTVTFQENWLTKRDFFRIINFSLHIVCFPDRITS